MGRTSDIANARMARGAVAGSHGRTTRCDLKTWRWPIPVRWVPDACRFGAYRAEARSTGCQIDSRIVGAFAGQHSATDLAGDVRVFDRTSIQHRRIADDPGRRLAGLPLRRS